MRRRLVLAMIGVTVGVLLLVGLPLVVLVDRLARAEAAAVLRRQAETIATDLAELITTGQPVTAADLAAYAAPGDRILLRATTGSEIATGPPLEGGVVRVEVEAIADARLVLETPSDPVEARTRGTLVALGMLAAGAIAVSGGLAAVLARRLAQPLDSLASSAARLGAGDFSTTSPRTGIAEMDTIADALDSSARRIAVLVRNERQFSANASHQLRSAMTGLTLGLEPLATSDDEAAATDARAALEQADRLTATIDDLLRLARTGRFAEAQPFDVGTLVERHAEPFRLRLARHRRALTVERPDPGVETTAVAAQGAIGQALDVLLDNAVRHGAGGVGVRVDPAGAFVAVTVSDAGTGIHTDRVPTLFDGRPRPGGHGIGLQLARTLVEADGGRLDLVSARPATFRLLIPTVGAPATAAGHDVEPG